MLHDQRASLFELITRYFGGQIKEDKIDKVCSMRGGK